MTQDLFSRRVGTLPLFCRTELGVKHAGIMHWLIVNGMDWISNLRAPQIAQLAEDYGPFQPSLFDERNLIEVSSRAFPEERARKRDELLAATEVQLQRVVHLWNIQKNHGDEVGW